MPQLRLVRGIRGPWSKKTLGGRMETLRGKQCFQGSIEKTDQTQPLRGTTWNAVLSAFAARDTLSRLQTPPPYRMRHKILLVDDHQLVREGVKRVLEQDSALSVCGEAENGKEAVAKTLALNPDLVLMDLSMPIMGGIEATGLIRQMSPDTKILIVSLHDSAQVAEQAKKAGANAFLCKSRSADDLIQAINTILQEGGDGRSQAVGREPGKRVADAQAWKRK